MKIEFLYFDGCPNQEKAWENLNSALMELHLNEDVKRINIHNNEEAQQYRFLGSPSIRINEKDIAFTDDNGEEYSMSCRQYRYGSETLGYPTKKAIMEALKSEL